MNRAWLPPSARGQCSRRQVLRTAGTGLGAALGLGGAPLGALLGNLASPDLARAQALGLVPYLADVDGDGRLSPSDEQLILASLDRSRGYSVKPNKGYDYRADLFARGRVGETDLNAYREFTRQAPATTSSTSKRPITVAWHYGWYRKAKRNRKTLTVGYLEGDYASSDPAVEWRFNRLKNEFGVTVDALSWISPTVRRSIWQNYTSGYLQARNARTRYMALLYEAGINLGSPGPGKRVDFNKLEVRNALINDFILMARHFAEASAKTRIFTLEGKPVIFFFGTHAWGVRGPNTGEFDWIDDTLEVAQRRFRNEYGTLPYLVGDELLLSEGDHFGNDRLRRLVNFNALYSYHHASSQRDVIAHGGHLRSRYVELQKRLNESNWATVGEMRNRFNGRRLLIIPSLAAGFAKTGLKRLWTTRKMYVDFLRTMQDHHLTGFVRPQFGDRLGTSALPAPIVSVGSWNEEFEGHAILPARFNKCLESVEHKGFDLAMAVKQVFGWNHYARRPII